MVTKKMKQGLVTGAALVAVGAAAAAAGYYFYGSEDAPKHRKIAVKWASDMKKEVLKKGKELKKIDAGSVALIVDQVSRAYQNVKSVDTSDVLRAAKELKTNWESIAKELGKGTSRSIGKPVKTAQKTAPRVVKKAKKALR